MTTISINDNQANFIKSYYLYGFKSEDELITEALERLRNDVERTSLTESAALYTEVYNDDEDLRELTTSALLEKVND